MFFQLMLESDLEFQGNKSDYRSVLNKCNELSRHQGNQGGEPPEAILAEPVTSMSFFTAVSATKAFQ